jgi:hypothetical protein
MANNKSAIGNRQFFEEVGTMRLFTRQMLVSFLSVCMATFLSAQTSMTQPSSVGPQTSSVLRVKTDVLEAQVILDGKEVGRTPLTLRDVTTGKHKLIVLKDGYEDHAEEVEVLAQQTSSVFVVMKPTNIQLPELPFTFKAIHQHRLGFCTGELTISADALDYKAVDDEDKFHISISDIKSVARSWGPIAGVYGINAPTDLMAMRIETSGRSYGFMAFQESVNDKMDVASAKTKQMYEVVYRLWSATLKPKATKK